MQLVQRPRLALSKMTTDLATLNILATPLPTTKPDAADVPYGRTSPRSPLDCALLGPSGTPPKKSVVINCSPPTVHINNNELVVVPVPVVPSPSPRRPRKVSFSNKIHCQEVRHIRDYSPEEIETLWMTMKDYQFVKAVVKSTVLMMMNGQQISEDDPDVCTRGLEFRTKAGARFRNRNKISARAAVLNEQDMQLEEGFFDPQYIAMVSEEASQNCREGAFARAVYDQRCVQDYLRDVRKTST